MPDFASGNTARAGAKRDSQMYTYRKGVLRRGTKVLPLPIAESYRLSGRVAFAVLLDYFEGELHAERKAFALHYALTRYISGVCEGWSLSRSDLDKILAAIFCAAKGKCQVEIMSAETARCR